MPLTLSVTDNRNGTGATATIAGSDPAATNQVLVQSVTGQLGAGAWSPAGSRLGDGTLGLGPSLGYYWAYCASTLAGVATISNLVYFLASRGSDAVLYRCLTAVQARIASLALSGIASGNIVIRKVVSDRDVGAGQAYSFPTVQISPIGREEMNSADATNLRDTIVYSVLVAILAADNQDQSANFASYLLWREVIARAFRNQLLPGVDEVFQCEVLPQDVVAADAFFRQNLFSSALILRFVTREPRGIATE